MCTARSGIVVVDCLTLRLTNWLCQPEHDDFSKDFSRARAALFAALQARHADEILVSNETGLGIIPLGALTGASSMKRAGSIRTSPASPTR